MNEEIREHEDWNFSKIYDLIKEIRDLVKEKGTSQRHVHFSPPSSDDKNLDGPSRQKLGWIDNRRDAYNDAAEFAKELVRRQGADYYYPKCFASALYRIFSDFPGV